MEEVPVPEPPTLEPNALVQCSNGPWAGSVGRVADRDGEEALVTLIDHRVQVAVPLADLTRLVPA
jgi:hypothetical protein